MRQCGQLLYSIGPLRSFVPSPKQGWFLYGCSLSAEPLLVSLSPLPSVMHERKILFLALVKTLDLPRGVEFRTSLPGHVGSGMWGQVLNLDIAPRAWGRDLQCYTS